MHAEDAEDAEHTHETENGECGSGREQEAKPSREDGEEVDDAVERKDVAPRFVETVDAEVVFEGEDDGENPADETHREGEPAGGSRHAFEHDDDDVECDEDEEPDVEFLAGGGIGFEDDGVDLLLGERAEAFRKQDGEEGAVENVADEIDDLPEDFGVWDVDNPAEDGFNYFFHL